MKASKHVERLLRQGRKRKELIELGFPKSIVTRVSRQLKKEMAALKVKATKGTAQAETQLSTPPGSPEEIATIWQKVQFMADDLQRIDNLIQALSEVSIVIAAARELGTNRCENCPYHRDGLCHLWTWNRQDEIHQGIGEPVQAGDDNRGWHVKPSPLYCAMCAAPLEGHIDGLEYKLSGDPLSGVKYQFTCSGCGGKGWIATRIKCIKCGRETYWGWFPKE